MRSGTPPALHPPRVRRRAGLAARARRPRGRSGRTALRAPARPSARSARRRLRPTGAQRRAASERQCCPSLLIRLVEPRGSDRTDPEGGANQRRHTTATTTADPDRPSEKGAKGTMRKLVFVLLAAAGAAAVFVGLATKGSGPAAATASSHREAP